MNFEHDIVIIGAGLAGLRAAVECADATNVAVVSKVLPPGLTQVQHKEASRAALGNEEGPLEWHFFDTVRK
jgi:succinate dehydrogenase / fumarate reductase flavoprotein subunit